MNYYDEICGYVARADNIIKNMLVCLSPLYKEDFGNGQDITVPLFTTLHSTSESILVLLLNQALFDADVLLRTVMEGTMKYCYLMTGDLLERTQKHEEYRNKLTDVDRLIDHAKAVQTVVILENSQQITRFPLNLGF